MPELVLRSAVAADIPAVLDFWAAAAENTHRPPDDSRAVEALLGRDPDALILAVRQSQLIGTIIAGWDGWRCHLYRLAVSPEHRRQGVGRLLVETAEARFRQLGGVRADAMVLDGNTLARQAWQAQGYHRQDESSRWVKPLPGT